MKLKQVKFFTVLMFVCSLFFAASLTSCKKSQATGEEAATEAATEHPAADSTEHAEHPKGGSEHPKGESEHPNNDSTKGE